MAITQIPTRMLPASSGSGGGGGGMPEEGEPGEPGPMGPPGPQGPAGAGATGAQGPMGPAVFMEAEPGQDGMDAIPGQAGSPGNAGATGAQGPMGPAVFLEAEPGEDGMSIPGPAGAAGSSGSGSYSLVYGNAAASSAIGSSSNAENDFDKTYTFPANSLTVGDIYRVRAGISGNNAVSTQTHTFRIYLGTNAIVIPFGNANQTGTGAISVVAEVYFTVRSTGGSGTVDSTGNIITQNAGVSTAFVANSAGIAIVVDTTATAVCKASYKFSSSNISNNVTLRHFTIEKLGTGT